MPMCDSSSGVIIKVAASLYSLAVNRMMSFENTLERALKVSKAIH